MTFNAQGNKVQSFEKAAEVTISSTNAEKSNRIRSTATEPLSSFMEATTLHGAQFLVNGNVFRRLFWTLALISCFGYCVYQVYQAVEAFYGRPFNTRITTKGVNKEENIIFPAVTLCNFNSFNQRRYRNLMKKHNLSSDVVERNLNIFEEMLAGSKNVFNNKSKQENPNLFERQFGEVPVEDHYLALFSHRIEEMLLPSALFESCDINGMPCSSKNFTSFINSAFGQCYTLNSGHDAVPVINATMAGHLNGLKLLLNVERDSYLDNPLEPFVGLTVLVHDQHTFPVMEQFGFAVQPGVRTLCAIKKKKIINLPSPYLANCTTRNLEILRNTNYTYSKAACLLQCLSQFVIKKCGCRPVEYKADLAFPVCAPSDTVLCMFPTYETFGTSKEKEICENSCPEPCNHTEYETSLSYAGLQRNVFIKKLNSALNVTENFPIHKNFLNMSYSEKKEYINDNIVSLDIYFKDMSYDEFQQTPQFSDWTLIATLGGNFGLFLGMSILTILEFVDFALRKMCSFIWQQQTLSQMRNEEIDESLTH